MEEDSVLSENKLENKNRNRGKFLEGYDLSINNIDVNISIIQNPDESVPDYIISIANISTTTKIILEKIREDFVSKVRTKEVDLREVAEKEAIKKRFKEEMGKLLDIYFPNSSAEDKDMLMNYLMEQNLGLGNIEILLQDDMLEEIVVNSAQEPIWVYHKRYGWVKTNIKLLKESKVRHYATMIGRDVNKEITLLNPLLDAHLETGDRVNATLSPISTKGNTLTIRKFRKDPWTITDFMESGTINVFSAALLWQMIENEFSIIIGGGTGSGKTSVLNALASFFPPNQRIISIEDTRELTLPQSLHWVPMETRLPNPEGKGGVDMLDLVVNSLRMRPDRIVVGEIRRQEEAQVLFEAMHTGHSVYGTFHANNVHEAVQRLTNEPINLPKPLLSSLGAFLIQNRDRRSGKRMTLQIAEMDSEGNPKVVLQYDPKEKTQIRVAEQTRTYETIGLYTGMTKEEVNKDIEEKMLVLKWLSKKKINNVHKIGVVMARYYRGNLMRRSTPDI
ncbi:MAG: type II/IV secretion system ATPase subunit [Candidatus Woesearchaeota archaeon]